MSFSGYSRDIYKFFADLSKNNNKEWFDNNRNFYDNEIKNKSKELINDLSAEFKKLNVPYLADSKISLFRINRDIRFSQDKSPYKTYFGIIIPRNINVKDIKKIASGVYIHFSLDECFIATGMHNPESNLLKLLRNKIYYNWDEYYNIINHPNFKNYFPIEYEPDNKLKKVQGFSPTHPAYEYIKKKSFTYYNDINNDVFYSKNLIDIIIKSAIASDEFSIFLNDTLLEI